MKKRLLLAGVLLAGALFSGCAVRTSVAVGFAPPSPRYAVVGVAPGPGYVWTEGYYSYRGNAYAWVPGRWMRPPHPHAEWVPGAWVQGHHGYEFRKGYWR